MTDGPCDWTWGKWHKTYYLWWPGLSLSLSLWVRKRRRKVLECKNREWKCVFEWGKKRERHKCYLLEPYITSIKTRAIFLFLSGHFLAFQNMFFLYKNRTFVSDWRQILPVICWGERKREREERDMTGKEAGRNGRIPSECCRRKGNGLGNEVHVFLSLVVMNRTENSDEMCAIKCFGCPFHSFLSSFTKNFSPYTNT